MIAWLRPMVWCLFGLHFSVSASLKVAAQDATAYQKACGDCHPASEAIARKIRGSTEEEKKTYLRALLTRHHMPNPADIDQVIGYLLTLPQK